MLKLISIPILIILLSFTTSISANIKDNIVITAYCVSVVSGEKVLMRSQTVSANFFKEGMFNVTTNDDGQLRFNGKYKADNFRLNGIAQNGDIVPGCNTGVIQQLADGMVVVFSGIDCGLVKACIKPKASLQNSP